jgi:hypothetical protein
MHGRFPLNRRTGRPLGRACLWGAALVALAPLVTDCGSGGGENEAGGAGDPCATVYRGQCGTGCAGDDGACPAGLFCGDGVCTAQCTPEGGCDAGQTCSPRGRCVAGVGGGSGLGGGPSFPPGTPPGGGTSGGPGAGGGGNCPDVSVAFQPINPAVMLVVDRSTSMACAIDSPAESSDECELDENSPDSRWLSFREPVLRVVRQTQDNVIFGSYFYPDNGSACDVPERAAAKFKLNNLEEITQQYDDREPNGSTPTGPAIEAATKLLRAADSGLPKKTPKFIILASDGSPNCGEGGAAVASDAEAVASVSAAFGKNVRTFVIGVGALFNGPGGADRRARFQAMANAGAGLPPNGDEKARIYFAANRQALAEALEEVVNGVRSCSFDLDVALDDPTQDAPKGVVKVDGKDVPFNETDGWRLTDPDTVEFVGSWCETIRKGATEVKATFPCDVKTTPSPNPPPPR